jgi:hypothetical protein
MCGWALDAPEGLPCLCADKAGSSLLAVFIVTLFRCTSTALFFPCCGSIAALRAAAWAPRSSTCAAPRASASAPRSSTCDAQRGSSLGTAISTCEAQRGNGLGATMKYLGRTTSGAAGIGLGTTAKY